MSYLSGEIPRKPAVIGYRAGKDGKVGFIGHILCSMGLLGIYRLGMSV